MPIYAYKCGACGHRQDILQKVSDPAISLCPACGAAQFAKQLTAAGFQLKGSGWYATDFRGGKAAPADDKVDKGGEAAEPGKAEPGDKSAGAGSPAAKAGTDTAAKPAADKPTTDKPRTAT